MRNYFDNSLNSENVEKTKKLKQWVKLHFGLPEDGCVVLVSEIKCADEGCPDVETIISILKQPQNKVFKIGKSIIDIKISDVENLSEKYLTQNITII